jgi:branched-chain amino acid transport system permease protein
VHRRGLVLLGPIVAALVVAPWLAGDDVISVLILCLYFAFVGQAWNIMMGFAGQLSLGHSLYVGLGAYVSASLFVHFQVPPWIGLVAGMAVAAAVGGIIGGLGFRFRIRGVYFALLTIAFAEFIRVLFDHFAWVGGSSGLFLPVSYRTEDDLLYLRGSPTMFYYVIFALAAGAFALSRAILASKIGYYWQAIREDQEAAEALGINAFRYKMLAVLLSAALTSAAGAFYAFYYNNLYPETIFSMHKSIELLLGVVVGGLGTLFGPVLGAFVLTLLGEAMTRLAERIDIDGVKQIALGICLLLIIVFRPEGLWPPLARALGLGSKHDA